MQKRMPGSADGIPDKLYFRIGEVARLCEVPAYVLRFWESEFPGLKPNKGGTGQRLYRRRDVEMALRIKQLLYDEGYTIPGARQVVKVEQKQKEPMALFAMEPAGSVDKPTLAKIRKELREIAQMLGQPPGAPQVKRRSSVKVKKVSETKTQAAENDIKGLF